LCIKEKTHLLVKDWYSWANNQEIPRLWGRLPEHSAEYQTAVLEAIQAKIALEPNMESSGSCSEMWCKGIINMMTQTVCIFIIFTHAVNSPNFFRISLN
jgi:hypothetical protein